MVNAANLQTDNGIVHSITNVILSDETVVDIAIDNGFSTLATAVITAELLPALTNPFSTFTVFAPDNNSFDQLAIDLGTDLNGILALPNLTDILLYHVLDASVDEASVNNGLVAQPLSTTNTIKMTKTYILTKTWNSLLLARLVPKIHLNTSISQQEMEN